MEKLSDSLSVLGVSFRDLHFQFISEGKASFRYSLRHVAANAITSPSSKLITACIDHLGKELSEVGLMTVYTSIAAFCNQRGCCESSVLITPVILTKLKVPMKLISFAGQYNSLRSASFVAFSCT